MRDIESLLNAAESGDRNALNELFEAHRGRLRKMVSVRIDPRLKARIDPSDVVQEALMKATKRFDSFLGERPIAFYPWLRQLAWDRLADLHQHHIRTAKRSVDREQPVMQLPNNSRIALARIFAHSAMGPQTVAIQEEAIVRLHEGLQQLGDVDREVLVLRFLEELSLAETAAVLRKTEAAVSMRQLRAIARLKEVLGEQ